MDLRALLLSLAGSSEPAHQAQAQAQPAPAPPTPPVFVTVNTKPSEELLGYAWDGGEEVVLAGTRGSVRIDYGAAGATPDTLLYLPFDHGRVCEDAYAPPSARETWEGRKIVWEAGRFGNGLAFSATSSSLVVRPTAEATVPTAGWTVEFWIRVSEGGPKRRGDILCIPGVVEIDLTIDRRIRATLERPDQERFTSTPIAVGAWTYVGFTLQEEFLSQARLVVGSQHRGRVVEALPAELRPLTLEFGAGGQGDDGFVGVLDDVRVRRYAATTQELVERGAPAPRVGLHRLELRSSAGTRVLEPWLGPTAPAELAADEDWARGRLEHAVVHEGALRWAPGHWERIETPIQPLARTTHPTVFLGNHRALVFGGETRDTHLPPMVNTGDTWIFHTDRGAWERLHLELEPAPRCHQSAAYSPDHDVVLLTGGYVNEFQRSEVLDDLWLFHGAQGTWERREPPALRPGGISDFGVVYHPAVRKFLLLQNRAVLTWDPATSEWGGRLNVPAFAQDGTPLPDFTPGSSFVCGVDPVSGNVVVFGGELLKESGEWEFFDQTTEYSPTEETLVSLALETRPSPRVRAGFAYDVKRRRFVLFGGVRDQFSQRNTDLWTYDPAARAWTERLASNSPSARGGYYHMAYDPELDRFFLLCGRHAPDRFLNEAWSLRLDDRAVGQASFVFDRQSWEGRPWLRLEAPPAGDASVSLRWRASDDGLAWGEWTEKPDALRAGSEFLQLELALHPGSAGEAPEVRSLRFAPERGAEEGVAGGVRWIELGTAGR